MKIETSTKFVCEIDDDIMDDWELLDAYADVFSGKPFANAKIPHFLFSDKDLSALKAHCRKENGRVSAKAMDSEVGEIVKQVGEKLKNLSDSPGQSGEEKKN